MMRPAFNVLKDPWIPVVYPDGSAGELGILPCLESAHDILEIRDPCPLIEFGCYRLLVAFVLDALIQANKRPQVGTDLKEMFEQGKFPVELLQEYAKSCGDVFDLFHEERPFLQFPSDSKETKPVANLYPAVPSGTESIHWHHLYQSEFEIPAAHAARLLSTVAPFMTAGGRGLSPSINGAPPIYALPIGKNLFETLAVNIPIRSSDNGNGEVAWRTCRPPGKERKCATVVEALTWRPRKIRFVPETRENGTVTVKSMKFSKGDSLQGDDARWKDPNVAYKYDKESKKPIRMREGRPLWRDAGPLALLSSKSIGQGEAKVGFQRADVLEMAFSLEQGKNHKLDVRYYGFRSDKKKVFEWTRSKLVIPVRLARASRLGSIVHSEMDLAEEAAEILAMSLRQLAPKDRDPNKKKRPLLASLVDRSTRNFWNALESNFLDLLESFSKLPENAPDDPESIVAARQPWRTAIETIARVQFEQATKHMGATAAELERLVTARSKFYKNLRKLLNDTIDN